MKGDNDVLVVFPALKEYAVCLSVHVNHNRVSGVPSMRIRSIQCRLMTLMTGLVASWAFAAGPSLPALDEVIQAKADLWGEAAMKQPNGASYEFFEGLLPPLRYVHADFRYYPIVLSTPGCKVKARLISNGSGINLRGGSRSWNPTGTAVVFRVGPDEFLFGGLRDRLTHPTLAEGYLPIVEIDYRHPHPFQMEGQVPLQPSTEEREAEVYRLEVFTSSDPAFADNAVVMVKFSLARGTQGVITAGFEDGLTVRFSDRRLLDGQGRVLAWFDDRWKWERDAAHASITTDTVAVMALATCPLDVGSAPAITPAVYHEQRRACAAAWKAILARGMSVEVPEARVNHAWRNHIIQNFGYFFLRFNIRDLKCEIIKVFPINIRICRTF